MTALMENGIDKIIVLVTITITIAITLLLKKLGEDGKALVRRHKLLDKFQCHIRNLLGESDQEGIDNALASAIQAIN